MYTFDRDIVYIVFILYICTHMIHYISDQICIYRHVYIYIYPYIMVPTKGNTRCWTSRNVLEKHTGGALL